MPKFWFGHHKLDRFVLRSLRRFTSANESELLPELHRMLINERAMSEIQILPDEDTVWCSLQRLVLSKHADKYVDEISKNREVRYRVNAKR